MSSEIFKNVVFFALPKTKPNISKFSAVQSFSACSVFLTTEHQLELPNTLFKEAASFYMRLD